MKESGVGGGRSQLGRGGRGRSASWRLEVVFAGLGLRSFISAGR